MHQAKRDLFNGKVWPNDDSYSPAKNAEEIKKLSGSFDDRLDSLENDIMRVEGKTDNLRGQIENLAAQINQVEVDLVTQITDLGARLDKAIADVDAKVDALQAKFDLLNPILEFSDFCNLLQTAAPTSGPQVIHWRYTDRFTWDASWNALGRDDFPTSG